MLKVTLLDRSAINTDDSSSNESDVSDMDDSSSNVSAESDMSFTQAEPGK